MRVNTVAMVGLITIAVAARGEGGQQSQPAGRGTPTPVPGAQTPGTPGAPPGPTTPGQTTLTPPPVTARVFTAPAGLLFNTVRPERVADFEKLIAYVQAALEKSKDPTVQAQAKGWRVFKATEPGPNGTVLYVFVLDPAVAGPDYGIGRILAEAYPDTAQLQEIWKLYTGSVTSGGSMLNLTPVKPPAELPPLSPGDKPAPAPPERPLPPDADPNRKPQ